MRGAHSHPTVEVADPDTMTAVISDRGIHCLQPELVRGWGGQCASVAFTECSVVRNAKDMELEDLDLLTSYPVHCLCDIGQITLSFQCSYL